MFTNYNMKFPLLRKCKNPYQREAHILEIRDDPFLVVGPESPKSWRKEVFNLARNFKREQLYDFIPYNCQEPDDPQSQFDRVLVFYDSDPNNYTFWGAVGITRRVDGPIDASEEDKHFPCWALSWAWLHPWQRRQGHLTNAWPYILKMYPNLNIEEPFSPAMIGFLKKVSYQFDAKASELLIFDLVHRRIEAVKKLDNALKKTNPNARAPLENAKIRLPPEDFQRARRQIYDRGAVILPDDDIDNSRFFHWFDWNLISDPTAPGLIQQFESLR